MVTQHKIITIYIHGSIYTCSIVKFPIYTYAYIITVKLYQVKPMEMLILLYVYSNIYRYTGIKNEPVATNSIIWI